VRTVDEVPLGTGGGFDFCAALVVITRSGSSSRQTAIILRLGAGAGTGFVFTCGAGVDEGGGVGNGRLVDADGALLTGAELGPCAGGFCWSLTRNSSLTNSLAVLFTSSTLALIALLAFVAKLE